MGKVDFLPLHGCTNARQGQTGGGAGGDERPPTPRRTRKGPGRTQPERSSDLGDPRISRTGARPGGEGHRPPQPTTCPGGGGTPPGGRVQEVRDLPGGATGGAPPHYVRKMGLFFF